MFMKAGGMSSTDESDKRSVIAEFCAQPRYYHLTENFKICYKIFKNFESVLPNARRRSNTGSGTNNAPSPLQTLLLQNHKHVILSLSSTPYDILGERFKLKL